MAPPTLKVAIMKTTGHALKIAKIATALGSRTLVPDHDYNNEKYGSLSLIVDDVQFSIWWGVYGKKGRYVISPTWPMYRGRYVLPQDVVSYMERQHLPNYKITVGDGKSVEDIVKDIRTRFLPNVISMYKVIQDVIAERTQSAYDLARFREEAAVAMGCSVKYPPSGEPYFEHIRHFSVKSSYPDTVTVEISLNLEELAAVKALLDQIRTDK